MKIFAIEPTNVCNAKCSFCPYPTPAHTRDRGYMTDDTLRRICDVATEPRAVNLSGLGEPTLHKRLPWIVSHLSANGFRVQLNTNGKRFTQAVYDELYGAGLSRVVITADFFPWERGGLRTHSGCPVQLLTITRDPDHPELGQSRKELDDWAGQVGKVTRERVRCSFLHDDFYQITWDGRVLRCCADFNANHSLGNIHDDALVSSIEAGDHRGRGIPLCGSCHGFVFRDGLVAGDFAGKGDKPPEAFVQLGG